VIYIETTPEKPWKALTDGPFTERYRFGARLRSDWKVGSSFEMVSSDQNTLRRFYSLGGLQSHLLSRMPINCESITGIFCNGSAAVERADALTSAPLR
jgi:hypothetical protein